MDIGIQICDLLQYLYSLENPVLYLDLQPSNVIISNKEVKLIDFGASAYKNQVNNRKYSLGTKGFAAPELYGNIHASERTDIYGLGALLYYMVTGLTYETKPSLVYNKSLKLCSKGLIKIIKTCLSSNPFFRYSNVHILKEKLLEIKNKKKLTVKTPIDFSEPIIIAVAGGQTRIGTTHLSLLITSYLNQIGFNSLYIEKNNSKHVYQILEQQKNIKLSKGIYELNNCNVLPFYEIQLPIDKTKYNFHILDLGILTQDNLEFFLEANIKTCILGTREWETKYSRRILKLLSDQEDIKYLFNFLDSKKFIEISQNLKHIPCYRIPYEPNINTCKHNKNIVSFIEGLLNY